MSVSRPRVLVNFAVSLDGKINPAPRQRKGAFVMSRFPEDARRMVELRAVADAVLIGAGNLRADDPDLALAPVEHARRRAAGEAEPHRIVVTRSGNGLEPTQKIFDPALGGPSYVIHSTHLSDAVRAKFEGVATLVELGESDVDMSQLLAFVGETLAVKTLLCEGGGVLCERLFAARAVDQLFLTLVPRVLGGTDAPTLVAGLGFAATETPEATLAAMDRVGDELFLRYDFRWDA